jgi:hypothetical protein
MCCCCNCCTSKLKHSRCRCPDDVYAAIIIINNMHAQCGDQLAVAVCCRVPGRTSSERVVFSLVAVSAAAAACTRTTLALTRCVRPARAATGAPLHFLFKSCMVYV